MRNDVNEYGVDMRQIKVGVTIRFDSPPTAGTVLRMDLPRLGVFQQDAGEKAIFHSLNVVDVEVDPDIHNSYDPGCDSCGTCMAHDGCADPDNPVDEERGDCACCGACGPCIVDCAHQQALDTHPYSSDGGVDHG